MWNLCVVGTQEQQRVENKTSDCFVSLERTKDAATSFCLGSVVLPRRGNTDLCEGDCVISYQDQTHKGFRTCSVVFLVVWVSNPRRLSEGSSNKKFDNNNNKRPSEGSVGFGIKGLVGKEKNTIIFDK